MGAKDKLRKKAKSLGKETKEAKEKKMAEAKSALVAMQNNPELAKMYKDNADVGAKNLMGELPLLKIHSVGKSRKNELADGTEPNDGYFFYKPTREQFEEIECHVLTISKGFRAEGMEDAKGEKRIIFNQILAGAIVDGKSIKPFIVYLTGMKLANMWEFGKEASKYTKAKPVPIPMFALKVKLTTEKSAEHKWGRSWIIKFEIIRDEKGNPIVVTDPGRFQFLRDQVEAIEDTIAKLIEAKSTEETVEELETRSVGEAAGKAEEVFKPDPIDPKDPF